MRRRSFIVGPIVLLGVLKGVSIGWSAEPSSEGFSFRVMTYNIHHGEGVDGRLDLDRIAAIIRDANCDLVALQELDRNAERTAKQDQLQLLADKTQMKPYFAKAIDLGSGEYGVGILSRLPITAHQVYRMPSDVAREQRVACEVRVEPMNGPSFVFVSTHLDHSRDDQDRRQQVAKLHELFGRGPSPAVLAGDLNATWEQEAMQPLRDQWQEVDAEKRPTSPAENPRRKIDHVWTSKAHRWSVRQVQVIDEAVASDHRPLVVELELKP